MSPQEEANLLRLAAKWTAEAQAQRLRGDRAGRHVASKYDAGGQAKALELAAQDLWGLLGLEVKAPIHRRCLGCQGHGHVPDPTRAEGWAPCPSCGGTGSPDIPPDADADADADALAMGRPR